MNIRAADWDHLFAINVRGMMLCCREAARRMNGRGRSIVITGSISGERPIPERAYRCAAKAAVHNYAQSVALQWLPPENPCECDRRRTNRHRLPQRRPHWDLNISRPKTFRWHATEAPYRLVTRGSARRTM